MTREGSAILFFNERLYHYKEKKLCQTFTVTLGIFIYVCNMLKKKQFKTN